MGLPGKLESQIWPIGRNEGGEAARAIPKHCGRASTAPAPLRHQHQIESLRQRHLLTKYRPSDCNHAEEEAGNSSSFFSLHKWEAVLTAIMFKA